MRIGGEDGLSANISSQVVAQDLCFVGALCSSEAGLLEKHDKTTAAHKHSSVIKKLLSLALTAVVV